MHVIVAVTTRDGDRPPPGVPMRVEIRDTSLADAPSVTVAMVESTVRGVQGAWLDTVEVSFDHDPSQCSIYVHLDVDGDGRVSIGDYVTMASYPVPATDATRVTVEVRRVV
ncbi:MAG TPA: hypothetical protein VD763_05010 [Candidatus Saccharimonadales bacterium]|nr:hypothetical protein [Candidatus Saccharimonadales bacterium]